MELMTSNELLDQENEQTQNLETLSDGSTEPQISTEPPKDTPEEELESFVETAPESVNMEAESVETEAEPVNAEAEPVEMEAKSVEMEAEFVETEAEFVETEAEPVETEAEPVEMEAEPVNTEAELVEMEAEPVEMETEPVNTEAEPMEMESEPVNTESDVPIDVDKNGESVVEPVADIVLEAEEFAQQAEETQQATEQSMLDIVDEIEAERMEADVEKSEMADLPDDEDEKLPTEATTQKTENIEVEYAALTFEDAVVTLENVVGEPNFNLIKLNVGILRAKILDFLKQQKQTQLEEFLAKGGTREEFAPEISDWENRFQASLQKFRNNKTKFMEQLEAEKLKNLELKRNIVNNLKALVETESNLKILNDKFKEFQEAWKTIGAVPQNESTNLWQNYHFYVEKFFDILRINRELRTLDLKKNLEQKMALCEQAEELLVDDSINNSFKKLQQLHEDWREIGPVPDDKKEEIWERFRNASNGVNQRRRDFHELQRTEQQNNYTAKVVLCEKAEELLTVEYSSLKELDKLRDQFNDLLNIWKTLGQAPAKLNDEIWVRFKTAFDKFFQTRNEQLKQRKETQIHNYNQKLNLAIQAEAIAQRTDWKKATEEIIALQKEWKSAGMSPRKQEDIVWKRFKTACDIFFGEKSKYFANKTEIETENLKKKEELIQKILDQEFGEDKTANLEILKELQREWTSIGYVPSKMHDYIYKSYQEALNKRFAELKIKASELRNNSYKVRIESILEDPKANKLLHNEKTLLSNKLKKLKDDVLLWENNLGFFAHSKNADLLTGEFIKKIDAAKEEIKDLEYKIRLLNKPKPQKTESDEEKNGEKSEKPE